MSNYVRNFGVNLLKSDNYSSTYSQ